MTRSSCQGRYLVSVAESSSELFRSELKFHAGSQLVERLDSRRHVCDLADGFESLFWQHVVPVQSQLQCSSLELEELICLDLSMVDVEALDSTPYGIQVTANKRLDLNFQEFVDGLKLCYQWSEELYNPRDAETVLSVHFHLEEGATPRAFLGASSVENQLSKWAGGEFRWAKGQASISRAEGKLVQALEEYDPGRKLDSLRVLDLGAAPGGWSRVLANRGCVVDAVDPAPLDPRLRDIKKIRHFSETASTFLRRTQESYDLIVSDMKMDANLAAETLVRLARRLKKHGRVLSTLKLPKGPRALTEGHEALKKISRAYDILEARQLYMNRSEVTVYLKPRAD